MTRLMRSPSVSGDGWHRLALAHRQKGFTLVELMVSLTLGLLIVVGLATVFLNVSRTNAEMAKTNSLIENGRFAIDLLQEDIVHAGFWGGYVPQFDDLSWWAKPGDTPRLGPYPDLASDPAWMPAPAWAPDPGLAPEPHFAPYPCWSYNATNWSVPYQQALVGIPVQSFDVVPAGCASLVTGKKPATDVLVVRHAETCLPGTVNCEADNSAKLYFQSSFCEAETDPDPSLALSPLTYIFSGLPEKFTLKKRGCVGALPDTVGAVSDKRKFVSNLYYIRGYAVTANDGIPTLMRSSFNLEGGMPAFEPAVALIEGIEGFAVELGLDTKNRCNGKIKYDESPEFVSPVTCKAETSLPNTFPINRGDGVPETPFVRCSGSTGCTAAQLVNTVAVKLYVLARSTEKTPGHVDDKTYRLGSATLGPFNDSYKRHVFQTTVRFNNVSGRRETP